MKRGSLLCVLLILGALVLAACGGDDAPPEVRPTLEPTLDPEVRIQFSSGQAENPLQMMIHPVDTVEDRLILLLMAELAVPRSRISGQTVLREDLGVSDRFENLNEALFRDFEVSVDKWDAEEILTVDDLVRYIQEELAVYVSDALFYRTGLYVDVILVEAYGDALAKLCQSYSGIVTMPWLDGVTLMAAIARNCGDPELQVAVADSRAPEFEELVMPLFAETPEVTAETPEATAEVTDEAGEDIVPADTPTATVTSAPTTTPTDEAVEDADVTPEATVEALPEETDTARALTIGDPGVVLFNQAISSTSVSAIQGRVFCRLGYDDFYSWFLPSLLMEQNNIDAQRSPSEIIDFEDKWILLQAVADGDCAATGLSLSTWERFNEDVSGIAVSEPTIPFPYGVFTYPLEVGLGVRLALNEQLVLMAADDFDGRPLRLLLGQDAIVPIEEGDFDALNAFMEATGFDFDQLGD